MVPKSSPVARAGSCWGTGSHTPRALCDFRCAPKQHENLLLLALGFSESPSAPQGVPGNVPLCWLGWYFGERPSWSDPELSQGGEELPWLQLLKAGKALTVLTDVQGGAAWTSLQQWEKGGEKPNSGLCHWGEIPSCSKGK